MDRYAAEVKAEMSGKEVRPEEDDGGLADRG